MKWKKDINCSGWSRSPITSIVFKWADVISNIQDLLSVLNDVVKKKVDKLLDAKTYIPNKRKVPIIIESVKIDVIEKQTKVEISDTLKEEIIDFIAYYGDYLNKALIDELYKIIDWKINLNNISAQILIDVDEKKEIFLELLDIIGKIDFNQNNKNIVD